MDDHADQRLVSRAPAAPRHRWTRRAFLRGSIVVGLLACAVLAGESTLGDSKWTAAGATHPQLAGTPPPSPDLSAHSVRGGSDGSTPIISPASVLHDSDSSGSPATAQAPSGSSALTTGLRSPNVLLVTVDTLRADRIGSYGFASAHTPVLDQLAREGVRFAHAVYQLPQTNASHAALMTGLYASTSGVKVHMVDKLRPGTPTLASVFESAGYQTAGIYSWVSLDPRFCGLNQGFQTCDGYVTNRERSSPTRFWSSSPPPIAS